MVTEIFLSELHEHIVSKGLYEVEIPKLEYYYKKIYSKELNKSCSSCVIEAQSMIQGYYRAHIKKIDPYNSEVLKQNTYKLKLALIEFGNSDRFELCQWIKNRIECKKQS
jgi:hypothetical protein